MNDLGSVAAVVLLRSVAGEPIGALSTARLSDRLESDPWLREARDTVRQAFEGRGFQVLDGAHQLTLTLRGSPALFATSFGVPEPSLVNVGSESLLRLEVPADVRTVIDTISVLPHSDASTKSGQGGASDPGADDLTGATVGRFRIVARLGAGGMGEVYRADDPQLKRTVAIKRLLPGRQEQAVSNTELLREARRASALNHPRIASVYDVFTVGEELFLVMEYVDGSSLRERLQSALSVTEFCRIAIQCTEALAAAHHRGIVHGDLKPSNIMLSHENGDVKVCDFGLARHLPKAATEVETTSTTRKGVAGTPAYMAPEVIRGDHPDERSDVFSLGIVFYEMLAGRNPFLADSLITTIDRIRSLAAAPLDVVNRDVPPRLARAVQRMIEKNPDDRCSSVSEVGHELAAIRDQLPRFQARRRSMERVRLAIGIGGVVVAVLGAAYFRGRLVNPSATTAIPESINLAILPFGAVGAGVDRQFFSQGLAEAVTRQLSRLTLHRNLQVATVDDMRERHVTNSAEAREQLGVNVVLTGSLHYSGGTVRVTCQLMDTRTARPIRSETFAADASDPVAVQDLVSHAGLRMLGLTINPTERQTLSESSPQRPTAYDFYLQARGYLLNFDRLENLDNAITVFRRALEVDPRYALAYAGLGQAYWRKHELTGAVTWVEPARAACEGAVGIDPKAAEGHACLGMVLSGTSAYERAAQEFGAALTLEPTNDAAYLGLAAAYERLNRSAEAERTYRRAIELRPHYWAGYNNLGGYYYRQGRYQDALAMFQQVVALAPDSFRGYSSLGALYFMTQQTEAAIDAFNKSLAIRPNYLAASNLGTLYYFDGQYRKSADAFRQALSLDQGNYQVWGNLAGALESVGDSAQAAAAYRRERELAEELLKVNPRDPALVLVLAQTSAALGDVARARALLASLIRMAPTDPQTLFDIAVIYEFRFHDRGEALKWLAKAIDNGQPWRTIDRSPYLLELRQDVRFQQLRRGR